MISAATINEVVSYVYNSPEYNKILKGIIFNSHLPNFYFEDVKNDIYTYILFAEPSNIVNLFNKDQFKWHFISVACKQIKSNKSKTYYTYIKKAKHNVELEDNHSKSENYEEQFNNLLLSQQVKEFVEQEIIKSKKNKLYFDNFKLQYFEGLNPRMISEKTGVSKQSVVNYVNSAKQIIIDKFKDEWK